MADAELAVNRVYLMLGGSCNYQCRHCVQQGVRFPVCQPEIREESLAYILGLAGRRPEKRGKITVMFWGGEPLIYIETIKRVVGYLGQAVQYAMVSNGALLTGEVVGFLNEHEVHFILSNDGPGTAAVRGENLLEDDGFVRLFKGVSNKSIDAVITAYNQDYYGLWEYIDSKLPGVHVTTEFLQCTWDMPKDLYEFDVDGYDAVMKRVVAKAHDDTLQGILSREVGLLASYRDEIMRVVERVKRGEPGGGLYPRCGQVRRAINLDLSGNIYACHNFADKIGTVKDVFDDLIARYDAVYSKLRDECADCAYVMFCRGGCPFVKNSDGKKKCCEVTKIFIQNCIAYVGSFANISGRQ